MSFLTAALWFVCVRSKTANGWHVPTHSQSSVMLLPKSPWLSFSHSAQMAHRRARRAKWRCGSIPSQDLLTENIHDKTWREKGSFCFSLIWYGEDDCETPDVWRQSSSAHVCIYILAFPSFKVQVFGFFVPLPRLSSLLFSCKLLLLSNRVDNEEHVFGGG